MEAMTTAIIITDATKVLAIFVSFNFTIYADKICRWLNIIAVKDAIYEYYMQGLIQKLSSMSGIVIYAKGNNKKRIIL